MFLCLQRGSRRFQVVQQNLPLDIQRTSYEGRLVDQEGSIWFSGPRGIDRFFHTPLVKQELPQGGGFFGLAADDRGAVLIAGLNSPVYRASAGKLEVLPVPKYREWESGSLYRAPDRTIWLGARSGIWHEIRSGQRPSKSFKQQGVRVALSRLTGRDWEFFQFPAELADQGNSVQAITQDPAGGTWISFGRRGLYRLVDGVWTPYGGRKDLPTTGVVCEFTDGLGRVWFGYTRNQLVVLDGDRVQVFGPNDGLRVGSVMAIYGRGPNIWIGGEFGLQRFDAGHLNNINAVNNEWLRGISGIVETANGDLWLNGGSGILHLRQSELAAALKNPSYQVRGDHFGRRNGLPGVATPIRPLPSAIEASDGRIWFAVTSGVVWLDPARSERRVAPPAITIQSVSADDKNYEPTFPLKLPAHTSNVQFSYSAVSLSEPEAIRFRYKLQETDTDWHDVGEASSVAYRSLPPGLYHFSVAATDTNGVWSDKPATAEFTILPAFYQTLWFRSLCVIAFLALAAGLYQLRLRQLAHQYSMRLEERLSERTRIARELHDSLLQGVQGLMFHVQAVRDMLPERPSEAIGALDIALERGDKAIQEGRDTVSDLRESEVGDSDIAGALTGLGKELAAQSDNGAAPRVRVLVEGKQQDLDPQVRDEIYRIAREALRNAFRHAQAQKIEAEITYSDSQFLLRVRDDGSGIDPQVINQGARVGHWGLPGMRERAKKFGGRLEVWSERGAGTEIQLIIPASVAYRKSSIGRGFWFLRKKKQRDPGHELPDA
jgi:signal transduction histidine kinase/streptogramin lyase